MYSVKLSKKAIKDINKLKLAGLSDKARKLIDLLKENSYTTPPSYEKLVGDLEGMYSRRINIQHRLVYTVDEEEQVVKVLRMWSHYE
ncbi:MAG: Txe/YoeB family addiction module toxin [Clostridia bacterium]|nr:Txe/YoeB family addiction module toxin [Clostridia bacterium]